MVKPVLNHPVLSRFWLSAFAATRGSPVVGKPWGQSARGLSVLSQPGSIDEPRDAWMCAEFAFVRGVEWRYLTVLYNQSKFKKCG